MNGGSGTPPPEADGAGPSLIRRILLAVRHPLGGASWPAARDPQATISFEDAERAAFKSSGAAPIAGPSIASQLTPPRAAAGPPVFVLEPAKPAQTAATFRPVPPPPQAKEADPAIPPSVPSEESLPEPAPLPSSPDGPGRRRRQAGETAPESLLRTPTGASSVTDDFFDGLIRRVEGDR